MLYNIKTGYNVERRDMSEIAILVSSLPHIAAKGIPFVFTDRHAYLNAAQFYNSLTALDQIPWSLLEARDFKIDPEDPEKKERYQCEALVYQSLPIDALLGIQCFDLEMKEEVDKLAQRNGVQVRTSVNPRWYF